MATSQEKQDLQSIRQRHSAASVRWSLSPAGTALQAVIIPDHPPANIATLTDNCGLDDRAHLLHAHDAIGLLLRLLDRAIEAIRRQADHDRPEAAKPKGYAAECAIKCTKPDFLTFLREEHSVDTTDAERIAVGIRGVLNVGSRNELNTDPAAAARWLDLRASFDLWSRT